MRAGARQGAAANRLVHAERRGQQRAAAAGVVVRARLLHVGRQHHALLRPRRAGNLRDERAVRPAMEHRLDVDVHASTGPVASASRKPRGARGVALNPNDCSASSYGMLPHCSTSGCLVGPRVAREVGRDHAGRAARAHGLLPHRARAAR